MNQRKKNKWLSWGIILVAMNLRVPITVIPPMIPKLSERMGLSSAMAGILTTIPLIMFALTSALVAKWGRKIGNERSLMITLLFLLVGSSIRIIPSFMVLIVATILIGIGISGGNVLLPAIIKNNFPYAIAKKTTVYTVIMGVTAALGMGLSGWLVQYVGITTTLTIFTVVPLFGVVVWTKACSYISKAENVPTQQKTSIHIPVFKSPLAWGIAAYFGLQAFLYYSLMTWLPTLWQGMGFTNLMAGNLTTIFQLCGMPAALVVPTLTEKRFGMKISVIAISCLLIVGTLGIMLPGTNVTINIIAALFMGLAIGAVFPLCMIFFQKKTTTHRQTADLSGFSQSVGYLFAAIGPVLYGSLQEWTGTWHSLLWVTIVVSCLMLIVGLFVEKGTQLFD